MLYNSIKYRPQYAMSHSPYTQTVNPPIMNLKSYGVSVHKYRAEIDEGNDDKYTAGELLEIAEDLLEHC